MTRTLPLLLTACLCLTLMTTRAQVNGGQSAFAFLELPLSPRITALGGQLVSVRDEDANNAPGNPALLHPDGHQRLSFQHQFHLGGIGNGYFGYAHHVSGWKTTLHAGFQYVNYGDIPLTDAYNHQLGTFRAAEHAVVIGASRTWQERLSYGVNLRYVQSSLESYRATAIGADAGVYYENPESRLGIGMVVRHMGLQTSRYQDGGARESLPFNVLIGVSKRLAYLPFRLSVTAHSLHRWDVRYDDPSLRSTNLFTGQDPDEKSAFSRHVDNVFRHLVFSGEFLFGKREAFRIRLAYDHRMRREMLVPNYQGLAGFSGGLGFRVYKFRLDYGFAVHHLAGATHHLGIGVPLKEFTGGI